MVVRQQWIQQAVDRLLMVDPSYSNRINELEEKFGAIFDRDFIDPKCIIYDNYEDEEHHMTLSKVVDWIDEVEPIVSLNGGYFKQHADIYNPDIEMLGDKLADRKRHKKLQFHYDTLLQDHPYSEENHNLFIFHRLTQGRIKVEVNTDYGIGGLRSGMDFNYNVASSTTLTCQYLISTAYVVFENYLANNIGFYSMDECLTYVYNIVNEPNTMSIAIIDKPVNRQELFNHLSNRFEVDGECSDFLLYNLIQSLTEEEVTRVYLKNNLLELFRRSSYTMELLRSILTYTDQYKNPYKPELGDNPDIPVISRKRDIELLNSISKDFVLYYHPIFERVLRLQTNKRKAVKIVDTDSTMCYIKKFVDFCMDEVYDKVINLPQRAMRNGLIQVASREKQEDRIIFLSQLFKISSTITYLLSDVIGINLDNTMKNLNVKDPEMRDLISMKMEFLFETMLNTAAMKHYVSSILVNEGVEVYLPRAEIKGMEFNKPSLSSPKSKAFYNKLVYEDILTVDRLDCKLILSKIRDFENELRVDLLEGKSFESVKRAKVKHPNEYAEPYKIGQSKALMIWNLLHPDNPATEYPVRVHMFKINANNLAHFEELSVTHPEIFKQLDAIFELEWMKDSKGKSKGIKSIAVPVGEDIPEWMKQYLDIDDMIYDQSKLSHTMLNAMGMKTIYSSKDRRYPSNYITT